MNNITTKSTIEYTKNLTILYVEDDVGLQYQTEKLFNILFKKVVTANNGLDALNIYKKEPFDIVITDIKMPLMDGVTLTSEIKKIDADQAVIVASAYNDTEYLLDFINLNIKQFIQKPIDMKNMLHIIYDVSKNIVNEMLVENYRKEVEKNNIILKEKNEELNSLVRILDTKISQISKKEDLNEIDINPNLFEDEHLNELKELEIDIDGAAVLINLTKNLNLFNIQVLGEMFLAYSHILSNYQECDKLASAITNLGETLNNAPQNFIDKITDVSILLESLIYVLKIWRKSLAEHQIKKAFELHASMINDIVTIVSIIDNTKNQTKR